MHPKPLFFGLLCFWIVQTQAIDGSWLDGAPSIGRGPINRFFASTITYKNTAIIHGGATVFDLIKGNSSTWNDTWQYFFETNTWAEMVPAPASVSLLERHLHSAVLFQDNMFIFGGASGQVGLDLPTTNLGDLIVLNLLTNEWSNVTTITPTHPRKGHAACVVGDLMILTGGWVDNNTKFTMDATFSFYNFTSNSWTEFVPANAAPFSLGRGFHSIIASESNRKLYIFGGTLVRFQSFQLVVDKASCPSPNITDIIEFSLDTNELKFLNSLSPPPAPLCWQIWHTRPGTNEDAAVLMSFEQSGARSFLNRVFNYTFSTNTWAEETSIPPPSGRIMGVVVTVPATQSSFFDQSVDKTGKFISFIWSGVFADPAKFLQNPDTFNVYINTNVPVNDINIGLAVGLGLGLPILVASAGVFAFFMIRKYKKNQKLKSELDKTPKKKGIVIKKSFRISKNEFLTDITFSATIGSGHFGVVYRGVWNEGTAVACKELADNTIIDEAKLLSQLSHRNIVQYYGIYRDEKEKLYLCMEFMDQGSLDRYVKIHPTLSIKQLLEIACDATNGMIFLSDRRIIHRDLALRNIFVSGETDVTVKIGDFGMSRILKDDIYRSKQKEVPVRWTSIEALEEGLFSVKSDVWAFGIVLWELFSMASMPYTTMSNQECYKAVKSGYRLPKPSADCPSGLHDLMLMCWKENADDRPNFQTIHDHLEKIKIAQE